MLSIYLMSFELCKLRRNGIFTAARISKDPLNAAVDAMNDALLVVALIHDDKDLLKSFRSDLDAFLLGCVQLETGFQQVCESAV